MQEVYETVKIHDKYQFEAKFTYPLDRRRDTNEYQVDTYVFLPNNLYINKRTYSADDFYGDLHKYIRLRTPVVHLAFMSASADSPMNKLEDAMRRLAETPDDPEVIQTYEDRLKMFCSIMKSALRDEEGDLERGVTSASAPVDIRNYLKQSDRLLEDYRELMHIVRFPDIDKKRLNLFKLVDEFLSITVNKYRYRLYLALERCPERYDWLEPLRREIAAALRHEVDYRSKCGYPTVPSKNSDNEELIYRENILKKVMASVLFLRSDTRRGGVFMTNLVFGIAAGIAMAFATIVTFLSQNLIFQEFSLTFCIIVIVAYMGKDRIKELGRSYLYSKVKSHIYDYKTTIRSTLGKEVGVCRESFTFISESKLPPDIVQLRNKDYISELENGVVGEDIIHSKEVLTLQSRNCKEIYSDFNVDGLVNIVRFNVRHFLAKMDNPVKEIFMPDDVSGIVKVQAKRTYKIHLIIQCRMNGGRESYASFRLTLARNGIKRIERLA